MSQTGQLTADKIWSGGGGNGMHSNRERILCESRNNLHPKWLQ